MACPSQAHIALLEILKEKGGNVQISLEQLARKTRAMKCGMYRNES